MSSWQLKAWWKKSIYHKTWFCCHSCHLFASAITEANMLISAVITSLLSVLINYKIENAKMHSTESGWLYLWMRMKQLLSTEAVGFEVQHGHKTSYFFVSLSDGDNLLPILRTLAPTQSSSAESGDQWVIFNLSAATKAPRPFEHEKTVQIRVSLFLFHTGL